MVLAPIMEEGTRAQEQHRLEDFVKQLKDSLDKLAATLSELLKKVATINLKLKHATSRVEESGNGDGVLINRSRIGYHSHDTNSFQN